MKMRVGIITNRNLGSPWASTHFYIQQALSRLPEVETAHVAGQAIADFHSGGSSWKFGRRRKRMKTAAPFTPELINAVMNDLDQNHYDVLFALHCSTILPVLNINAPAIYVTDATAKLLNDYYPERQQQLSVQEIEWLEKCEQTTIARSDAILVPSRWAAESVMQDYAGNPEQVYTIEWGGNLTEYPQVVEKSLPHSDREVRFLFVGLDWERKGGDIAVETIEALRNRGIRASLTVVGASLPKEHCNQFVHCVGKLNRADPQQSNKLDQLFRDADFYIHPARAECYGHVLCEALGFGVPVIASRTGGISQCVVDGKTGLLLPPNSSANAYAERVTELLADRELLALMQSNAAADFHNRLNWDRWARRVQEILPSGSSPSTSASCE